MTCLRANNLDIIHKGVSYVPVDLSTDASLVVLHVVAMAQVETPVSKHSSPRTQTCVNVNSMLKIVFPLINERFSMMIDLVEELVK